jgi:hypothetical protein
MTTISSCEGMEATICRSMLCWDLGHDDDKRREPATKVTEYACVYANVT